MVFYRKYRPQTIEELDSKEVRERLYSVLGGSSIPHAYLFTGPKGLGKTSTARIAAKSLNCVGKNQESRIKNQEKIKPKDKNHNSSFIIHDSQIEPCNECDQCVSITNGTNLDILEVDGASNRGIDEVRDLREKIKLSPLSARKKVYIIDEVHMLTQEAFNALLKTLEEPPAHVVFILCTTEPHKVPGTILSRCLHIRFKKATQEELVRSFERIIKAEKIDADKEALELIAGLSDGSFRDGSKILEEIALVGKGKKITKELVDEKYQIASIQYQIAQMIRNLENKNTKNALEIAAKLTNEGVQIGFFTEELIKTLHNNLLFKVGVTENLGFRIESSKMETSEIKKLIELLSKANSELKYAVLPQIPLELAIVEWGIQKTQNQVQITQNTQIVRKPENQAVRKSDILKVRPSESTSFQSVPETSQQNISSYNEFDALWQALIDKVKLYNHSVAGVLRGCRIKSYDNKTLLIETNFKFHKEKLSEAKTFEVLQRACRDVTKKNIEVEVLLKKPA